jgi:hypothetical protein
MALCERLRGKREWTYITSNGYSVDFIQDRLSRGCVFV